MTPPEIRRAAIVGTAESWTRTPWQDPGLYIVGVNDAYTLGFPRADEWWDLHPFDHFWYRDPQQRTIDPRQIPPGHYVRPVGHIEKLREMAAQIPVWLQADPPAGWPENARRFPVETLDAKYGSYWASGPAYELMSLYDRGFREFQIYGIHLATEGERQQQRHNFEFLMGRLLGPDVAMSERDGLRTFDGALTGVRIVLPVESPLLQHGWKYAFEPKPVPPPNPLAAELKAVRKDKDALVRALVNWPTGKDRSRALARLQRLEIVELDITQQMSKRAACGGTLVARMKVA